MRARRHRWIRTAIAVVTIGVAYQAHAAIGPACDAGPCVDSDGDGFMSCACAPAGLPCDCDDTNPARFPGAPESCDSLVDNNCNAATQEKCVGFKGCNAGVCVPECKPLDDFGCPGGSSFGKSADGLQCLCIPQDCTVFGCPPGQTCDDDKQCVVTCSPAVKCPHGQRCRGDGCVDLCAGIACPSGSACSDGVCFASCDCGGTAPCPTGQSCDSAQSKCVETACIGINCEAGKHCEAGACIDDCTNVVCPTKRVCRSTPKGACVDLCSPDPCTAGFGCDWRTGACNPLPIADGGLVGLDEEEIERLRVIGGGFACASSFNTSKLMLGSAATLSLLVAAAIRRKRRRR